VDGTDAGVAINVNKYFNLVVWGVINRSGEPSHVMINLPTGIYNTSASAVSDTDGTAVFTIPSGFKGTGFLIARLTMRLIAGAQWTYIAQQDLRGLTPSTSAGVATAATSHALLANLDFASAGHTGFLAEDGSVALAGAWDMGSQDCSNTVLVAPALGTPASGVLTNCTGYTHAATTGRTTDDHHAETHTIVSHDTTGTGAELTSLTDNSMVDALHRHSELSASDGSPDAVVLVNTSGNVRIGSGAAAVPLHVRNTSAGAVTRVRVDGDNGTSDGGGSFDIAYNGSNLWSLLARNKAPIDALQILNSAGTARVVIAQDGKCGIRTTTPGLALDVVGDDGVSEGTAAYGGADVAVFRNNETSATNAQINIIAGTAGNARLQLGDKDDRNICKFDYDHNIDSLSIFTNNIVSLTMDSAQHIFIPVIASGATQAASGAAANELWKTASHATLPDNVVMIGV
jgi:hypothetical protein